MTKRFFVSRHVPFEIPGNDLFRAADRYWVHTTDALTQWGALVSDVVNFGGGGVASLNRESYCVMPSCLILKSMLRNKHQVVNSFKDNEFTTL